MIPQLSLLNYLMTEKFGNRDVLHSPNHRTRLQFEITVHTHK